MFRYLALVTTNFKPRPAVFVEGFNRGASMISRECQLSSCFRFGISKIVYIFTVNCSVQFNQYTKMSNAKQLTFELNSGYKIPAVGYGTWQVSRTIEVILATASTDFFKNQIIHFPTRNRSFSCYKYLLYSYQFNSYELGISFSHLVNSHGCQIICLAF